MNLYDVFSARFNGPFSLRAVLLSGQSSAPFEGAWVPLVGCLQATLEVSAVSGTTFSAALWGTNNPDPVNSYSVTVGGTVTAGNVLTLTFSGGVLFGSTSVTYTVQSSDTASTIAAQLAAAVAASSAVAAAGISAQSSGSVVTITYPSGVSPTLPSVTPAGNPTMNQSLNAIQVSAASTGATTLTVATGTSGVSLATISASVMTAIAMPVSFAKLRLASVSGGSVSAFLAATS